MGTVSLRKRAAIAELRRTIAEIRHQVDGAKYRLAVLRQRKTLSPDEQREVARLEDQVAFADWLFRH